MRSGFMENRLRSTEPFYFSGGRTGVLLLHGLSGSPSEMRCLGKEISDRGWTALGLCLSGHGSDGERLEMAGWEEWLKEAEAGAAQLKKTCSCLIGVGLSMGGLLALMLAGRGILDGVVTINAPLMMPLIGPGSAANPKAVELEKAIQEISAVIPEVKVPVLLMQSSKDKVIDPANVVKLQEGMKQTQTEVVYFERSGHVLTLGPERAEVASRTAGFIRRIEAVREASNKY
jgi:carboxylesterase